MAASTGNLTETDLIQEEMAKARHALERYHELTAAEHLEQRERLDSLEERVERLERSTESLRQELAGVLESKIWRTLVRGGSLIGKVSGGAPKSAKT